MFKLLLTFALLGAPSVFAAGDLFYADRGSVPDANGFFGHRIDRERRERGLVDQLVRVLDFNASEEMVAHNLVNLQRSQAIGARDYAQLTEAERAEYIFAPFLFRLIREKFLHIDHHYDLPCLRRTSTTVLIADFLLWIHEARGQAIPEAVAAAVLRGIENSYGILDHADADILFANYLATNATNARLLKRVAPLLKAVALMNDHLLAPGERPLQVYQLLDIMKVVEKAVNDGRISAQTALAKVNTLLRYVAGKPVEEANRIWIRDGLRSLKLSRARDTDLLTAMESQALAGGSNGAAVPAPGTISRRGPVLLVYPDPEKGECPESYTVCHFLVTRNSALLDGISVVATIDRERTGLARVRLRAVKDHVDLNRAYRELSLPPSLEAGGRATAGTGAYGRNGRSVTLDQLTLDLDRLVGVVSETCAGNLATMH